MWKPPINFITLHYAYIISFGILALVILYPEKNLRTVDAYFFGVSASTESGLNPVDLKALKTYQQVFLYIVPMITNIGFVNVIVVVVRLRWFRQRFKAVTARKDDAVQAGSVTRDMEKGPTLTTPAVLSREEEQPKSDTTRITFAPVMQRGRTGEHALYIPGPRERENGEPIQSLSDDEDVDRISIARTESNSIMRRKKFDTRKMSKATSMETAVSSIFVLGSTARGQSQDRSRKSFDRAKSMERTKSMDRTKSIDIATLTPDELGGIEYRALRVLLKVTVGYFVGLHLLGVICLVPWIHLASPKYREYLASTGQNETWWAIYSAQTMVDNLGLTLTPDSMISFRDATWPMLVMSFLAFAGNTFYPCFLRLLIWTIYKLSAIDSSLRESTRFLLDHPRRCYTLLFPGTATWILAAILITLNFLDTLLIIVLDLDNPEVNVLPVGSRILAAIFQAASARHTGTATFNLANVNPAVQFSLLVMMYISIYPIAISIRMSSDYEDGSVGLYEVEESLDEQTGGKKYLVNHMRNQLSFDLWYIFLGVFCICCAESERIMSREDYAFSVFSVFFEVVSAYGNVGLSLGHPSNLTSLSGHFNVFAKLVICAMMIRGRHRGLPYALDRAITLPIDKRKRDLEESTTVGQEEPAGEASARQNWQAKRRNLLRSYTQ
ncbi:hypothetical protein HBI56_115020 [Parastagonospora nodorum]|nr:hypothetical protein HBH51_029920 [Parastagonospora nodorum]KAH4000561.1 hypothetical protein HBI10_102670 [Parastagonospora nodorum]KAH4026495.1 hypothetical protein HBI13_062940 [Parastagonospora nodorum]KAH4068101.1 hypothetical protein HBH50_122550 [Parastagonospora nodorum]KAH4085664.1 hypothetical protein HBH48_152610 [Parastagonospora nodorum]